MEKAEDLVAGTSAHLASPGDTGGYVRVKVIPRGRKIVFLLSGAAPEDTPAAQIETVELRFTVDEALSIIEQSAAAVDQVTAEYGPITAMGDALRRLVAVAQKFGDYGQQ